MPEVKANEIKVIAMFAPDVSSSSLALYKNRCSFVELRPMELEKYPSMVQNLSNYRFKHLYVQNLLKEFKAVFYVDSSIQLIKSENSETLTVSKKASYFVTCYSYCRTCLMK